MPKEILFRGYYRGGAKTHVFPKYALSFFADLKATLDVPIQGFQQRNIYFNIIHINKEDKPIQPKCTWFCSSY